MARTPYPSEVADRFLLRMPEGMRAAITEAAKSNKRSMNAEVVARLEASLDAAGFTFTIPPEKRDILATSASHQGQTLRQFVLDMLGVMAEVEGGAGPGPEQEQVDRIEAKLDQVLARLPPHPKSKPKK